MIFAVQAYERERLVGYLAIYWIILFRNISKRPHIANSSPLSGGI